MYTKSKRIYLIIEYIHLSLIYKKIIVIDYLCLLYVRL